MLGRFEVEREGRSMVAGRRREHYLLVVLLLEANTAVPWRGWPTCSGSRNRRATRERRWCWLIRGRYVSV